MVIAVAGEVAVPVCVAMETLWEQTERILDWVAGRLEVLQAVPVLQAVEMDDFVVASSRIRRGLSPTTNNNQYFWDLGKLTP